MSQNPLAVYYKLFENDTLPYSDFNEEEIQFIAVCIGYPPDFASFVEAIKTTIPMTRFFIRQSIVEILRLEDLEIQSVGMRRVLKVEDITLNQGYTGSIREDLIFRCQRIASLLRLPLLSNVYVPNERVEGILDIQTQRITKANRGYGIGGYSVR